MRAHSLLVVVLALSMPAAAIAKPSAEQEAKSHFAKGKELVAQGKFDAALAEFSAGYELSERPAFLFNMGECARALSNREAARDYYERYLAADAKGPFADAAKKRLAELTPPPVPVPAAVPAPTPAPAPAVVVPTPAEAAATLPPPRPQPVRIVSTTSSESHWKRNALLVTAGLALVGGSVAIYVATREDGCPNCIDLRNH